MRIPNLTETVAAQEKASELNERFADWVWAEPDRAASLARLYNDTFNAIVLRNYDGAHRQFPGLAVTIELREHQVAAVVRMLSEPTVLLAHEVGAGKTLEMIVGCMELRRLGMTQKPAVVVPNHMLEQFSREWMQAYPQARILAASTDDLTRDRRRLFVARVATGDWDAVILSRSAFERLPLSPDAQQAYLDGQLADLRRQLENSQAAGGLTVKRLQGTLQRGNHRNQSICACDGRSLASGVGRALPSSRKADGLSVARQMSRHSASRKYCRGGEVQVRAASGQCECFGRRHHWTRSLLGRI